MENNYNKILLSFVLVNWNTKTLLLQCIKSIREECIGLVVEILVSDNASTDGSVEAVEALKYPDVRVIKNSKNYGFAGGNNIAIREAKGDYICLVNTDVEVFPNCFNILLQYMERNKQAGIVGPRVLNGDNTLQISARKEIGLITSLVRTFWLDSLFPGMTSYSHKMTEEVDVLSGCFWMIRRAALDEVGLLDENFFFYGEDRDYCKRMWVKGWKVVYHPEAQIFHLEGGSSTKKNPYRYYLLLERAGMQYWAKHSGTSFSLYIAIRLLYNFFRCCSNGLAFLLLSEDTYKVKMQRSWYSMHMLLQGKRADPDIILSSIGKS